MRLLVVDDDRHVRRNACRLLEQAGWQVEQAQSAEAARRRLNGPTGAAFDLLLLDVRMPGLSGWEFLAALRAAGDDTPVIFVSGVASAEERVRGLRLGADDYLAKPYSGEELLARIEAVMRRRLSLPVLHLGGLEIDTARRSLRHGDLLVALSPHEFDLLRALINASGHPVSREDLLREVWGQDFDPGTTVVEVAVARLRRKLDRLGCQLVQNVKGRGYRIAEGRGDPETGAAQDDQGA